MKNGKNSQKKYQVFVSSTYTDLILERQAAVEGILRSDNMPAGMELFTAGSKSQLDVIKEWISESDMLMVIIGNRYGSIEPKSQLSYTEIEYNYALELGKPVFALLMQSMKKRKPKTLKVEDSQLEEFNLEKFQNFRKLVQSKMCRFCQTPQDVKLETITSIHKIIMDYELDGWVRKKDYGSITQLKIIQASYFSNPRRSFNVTEKIQALIDNNTFIFPASNELFDDPEWGKKKQLLLKYSYHGEERVKTYNEDAKVILP